jgi:hypothetical protein
MWFEFRQYVARAREVPVSFPSLMGELMLYYVYLFLGRVKKSVQVYILGSKKLPSIIENVVSTFVKDRQLYRNEIHLEALAKFLETIICSSMVYLSIFGGGIMTYVCLVCLPNCLTSCSFCILFIFKLVKSFLFQNAGKQM